MLSHSTANRAKAKSAADVGIGSDLAAENAWHVNAGRPDAKFTAC
jgi:hypothetical protein